MPQRQSTILIVEDDPTIQAAIVRTVETEGHQAVAVGSGKEALQAINEGHPDLIILDIMLPDANGFDLCRDLRREKPEVPIIVLSAKTDEIDVVLGLEMGADDYVAKPFRPRELLARVATQLRKAKDRKKMETVSGKLLFKGLTIDLELRRVFKPSGEILLTHTEFDLLSFLARNAGKAVSREEILEGAWGYDRSLETRVIDVHIRNLRRKVEEDPSTPRFVLTVPGLGYRFAALKEEEAAID